MAVGRGGQLQGLAADGHGIVADTLQLDIGPDHRGQQAQVTGARQVQRNELVTHRVDLAHHAIDRMVVEDGRGRQLGIAGLQGMHGVLDCRIDQPGHLRDLGADVCQVLIQTFFVVCHVADPALIMRVKVCFLLLL